MACVSPSKEELLASIRPDMKLTWDFFKRIYGYEITWPGFADRALTALEAVGCSRARDHYKSWVDVYKRQGRIGKPSNLDSCVNELVKTVERLLDVSKIPQQMAETTTQQTELEHKLSIFEEKGVADKLKKQSGSAGYSLAARRTGRLPAHGGHARSYPGHSGTRHTPDGCFR